VNVIVEPEDGIEVDNRDAEDDENAEGDVENSNDDDE
jgi:hypothetical protein